MEGPKILVGVCDGEKAASQVPKSSVNISKWPGDSITNSVTKTFVTVFWNQSKD